MHLFCRQSLRFYEPKVLELFRGQLKGVPERVFKGHVLQLNRRNSLRHIAKDEVLLIVDVPFTLLEHVFPLCKLNLNVRVDIA